MRTQRIAAAFALTAICGLISCTDGPSPVSPGDSGIARLALAPSYSISGYFQTLPINRIRLTAFVAGSTTPLPPTPAEFDVNPDDESWSLPVEFELPAGEQVQVEVLIELVNVSTSGEETVEFSGRTAPVSVTSGNNQNVASVTVHPGPPENLAVNSVAITTSVDDAVEGAEVDLAATVDGPAGSVVTWGTLDPTLVQIAVDGARNARVKTLLPGNARIIAVAGPRSDTVTLEILQRASAVSIAPGDVSLNALDDEAEFAAQVLDPRGDPVAGAAIAWEIQDDDIATHLGGGRFRAESIGSTQIIARSVSTPSLFASAELTVAQRAADVDVSESDVTLRALDAEFTVQATAVDANGNELEDAAIEWSSADEDIATVDEDGTITAVANGSTTVTAELDDGSAEVTVVVQQVAVAVIVSPGDTVLTAIGETAQLSAVVEDSLGNAIDDADVDWESSADDSVGVSATGLVTALAAGRATITAESDDASGTASIRVEQAAAEITLDPTSISFTAVGQTRQLAATVLDGNGAEIANPALTWTSSNHDAATVSEDGLVTAEGGGNATITVQSGGAEAGAAVTVTQTAAAIAIAYELGAGDTEDELTVDAIGGAHQFSATVADENGHTVSAAEINWTSTNSAAADVGSTGLVTINGNGSAYIRAVSGDARDSVLVTVQQAAATIEVEPTAVEFEAVDETKQLTAIVRDGNANVMAGAVVDWTTSAADIVSVTSSGLLTARAQGTATITATSGAASTTIPASVDQVVGSVVIDPDAETMDALQDELQLTVEVLDQNGGSMDIAVAWTVIEDGIVEVSADGTVLSVGNGTARVVATAGTVADTATITVAQVATTIDVLPVGVEFDAVGETQQLTATVGDANGVTIEDAPVTWSSSDTTVVRVSAAGLLTAVAQGHAVITATSGAASMTIPANVMQVVASVVLTPATATLTAIDQQLQLNAVVRDPGGAVMNYTVTWRTIETGIVDVSTSGLVTARGVGTGRVVATAGTRADTSTITVRQDAARLVIANDGEPWPDSVFEDALGDTMTAQAVVYDAGDNVIPAAVVIWSSSNPGVVHITEGGFVTVTANGTTIIRAVSGSARDSIFVTVEQVPAEVTLSAYELSFTALGDTARIVAEVRDASDNLMHDEPITWVSSDSEVATVDEAGLVEAVGDGYAWIKAAADGAIDSAFVSVNAGAASVAIVEDSIVMDALHQQYPFEVDVFDSNENVVEAEILWESADTSIVYVGPDGIAHARGNGVAWIYASVGEVADSARVRVRQRAVAISFSAEDTIRYSSVGDNNGVWATVADPNGYAIADAVVAWTSTDTTVVTATAFEARAATIAAAGNGTAKVIATTGDVADTLIVVVDQQAASIIMPSMIVFSHIPDSFTPEASVVDGAGNPVEGAAITWSSSDTTIATVSADGVVRPVRNGFAVVTATSGAAEAVLNVGVIAPGQLFFHSLTQTKQLLKGLTDAAGDTVAYLSWTSADTTIVRVDPAGVATAAGNGQTQLSVRAEFFDDTQADFSFSVEVMQQIAHLSIGEDSVGFTTVGAEHQLILSVRDSLNQELQTDYQPGWWSGHDGVATVDSTGLVTAVGNGVTYVFAAAGEPRDSVRIIVNLVAASVSISPEAHEFAAVNDTLTAFATVYDANEAVIPDAGVAWATSDSSVVIAHPHGFLQATGAGQATVTATSGGASATMAVTVPQTAASVEISNQDESNTFASLTETKQLNAAVYDAQNNVLDLPVIWSSSDTTVATVSPGGLVTSHGNGDVTISAVVADETNTTNIVSGDGDAGPNGMMNLSAPPPGSSLSFTVYQVPASVEIDEDSVQLAALYRSHDFDVEAVRDARGQPLERDYFVNWLSQNSDKVSVGTPCDTCRQGRALALGNGKTKIIADVEGARDTALVHVRQIPGHAVRQRLNPGTLHRRYPHALESLTDSAGYEIDGVDFNWSSDNPDVIEIEDSVPGTIRSRGNGVANLRLRLADDGGDLGVEFVFVDTVSQKPGKLRLATEHKNVRFGAFGRNKQLNAVVQDSAGYELETQPGKSWRSDDDTLFEVDNNGNIQGKLKNGSTKIIVESGEFADTADVTTQQVPNKMRIESSSRGPRFKTLGRGRKMHAVVEDSAGHAFETPPAIQWISDGEDDVEFVGDSIVARGNTGGGGPVVVRARFTDGDIQVEDTTNVEVEQYGAKLKVKSNSRGQSMRALQAQKQLEAEVSDSLDNPLETQPELRWASDDTTTVSVASNGNARSKRNGSAKLRVFYDDNELSDTVTVGVQQVGKKIHFPSQLNPGTLNRNYQLQAIARDSLDNDMENPPVIGWSSSNASVLQVTEGQATSKGRGNAKAIASFGGVTDTMEVTVRQVAFSLDISGDSLLTALSDSATILPVAEDSTGTTIADTTFTYVVDDTTTIVPEGNGVFRARSNGPKNVTVQIGDLSTDFQIRVSQRPQTMNIIGEVNNQHGKPNQTLESDLEVEVLDNRGNPLQIGSIRWRPGQGNGSVDQSDEPIGANGRARAKWTLPGAAGSKSLKVWAVVESDSTSVDFAAVVDDAEPSAVTFQDVEQGTINFGLNEPLIISGTAHDDRAVDKVDCVLTNTGTGTQYGDKITHTYPRNQQVADQQFSCDFSATGLGIPTQVPLTLTVTVHDKARNQSVATVGVYILGPAF